MCQWHIRFSTVMATPKHHLSPEEAAARQEKHRQVDCARKQRCHFDPSYLPMEATANQQRSADDPTFWEHEATAHRLATHLA